MNEVLSPIYGSLYSFFYYILVYSGSTEDHQQYLETILRCLQDRKLFANKKKCVFGQRQLEYLVNVISREGMAQTRPKLTPCSSSPNPELYEN